MRPEVVDRSAPSWAAVSRVSLTRASLRRVLPAPPGHRPARPSGRLACRHADHARRPRRRAVRAADHLPPQRHRGADARVGRPERGRPRRHDVRPQRQGEAAPPVAQGHPAGVRADRAAAPRQRAGRRPRGDPHRPRRERRRSAPAGEVRHPVPARPRRRAALRRARPRRPAAHHGVVTVELPRAAALASRLEWLDEAGSTNTELVARAAAGWPDRSVLVTDRQTAGRGRLGRSWTAPPGTSLAVSVLVRPDVPRERYGWLSLLAGAAMAEGLGSLGAAADLKWPNDVLIGGREGCGILAEALPDGGAGLGAGLNHRIPADELPVATPTSLVVEGVPTDPHVLLAAYLERLWALLDLFEAASGDPDGGGLRAVVERACGTIGSRVRVDLPDGTRVTGTATGLDAAGRLLVAPERDAPPFAVAAG